jgi:hypothetical protein
MMMKELEIKPRKYPEEIDLLNLQKKTGVYSKGQKGLDEFLK